MMNTCQQNNAIFEISKGLILGVQVFWGLRLYEGITLFQNVGMC